MPFVAECKKVVVATVTEKPNLGHALEQELIVTLGTSFLDTNGVRG